MSEWIDPDTDKDFRTVIPPSVMAEWQQNLGAFLTTFAGLEDNLALQVSIFAEKHMFTRSAPATHEEGVLQARQWLKRQKVLKALIAGSGLEASMTTIRRLMRAVESEKEKQQEINRIFSHLGQIQYIRNRLAHNPAYYDLTNKENWFTTSNDRVKAEAGKADTIYLNASILNDLREDTIAIIYLVDRTLDIHNIYDGKTDTSRDFLENESVKQHDEAMRAPWRYKPGDLKAVQHSTW